MVFLRNALIMLATYFSYHRVHAITIHFSYVCIVDNFILVLYSFLYSISIAALY